MNIGYGVADCHSLRRDLHVVAPTRWARVWTKLLVLALLMIMLTPMLHAQALGGNVDSSSYAWGETLGWVDFGNTAGGVTVTDTAITGYAWSSQYGWINLGPFRNALGVTNTAQGTVGGAAWSDLIGWIYMDGVHIMPNGIWQGTANVTGTRAGRIRFDCRHCKVHSTWPSSSVATTTQVGTSPRDTGLPNAAQSATRAPSSLPASANNAGVIAANGNAASLAQAPKALFDVGLQPLFGLLNDWWVWLVLPLLLLLWLTSIMMIGNVRRHRNKRLLQKVLQREGI